MVEKSRTDESRAGWSRRDLLRASAGAAAIAVPMAALSSTVSAAAGDGEFELDDDFDPAAAFAGGQVVFSVRDAARGEVAIYHGTDEVIVRDRALVNRIMRAAQAPATK